MNMRNLLNLDTKLDRPRNSITHKIISIAFPLDNFSRTFKNLMYFGPLRILSYCGFEIINTGLMLNNFIFYIGIDDSKSKMNQFDN